MDAHSIALVQSTFASIVPVTDRFSDEFYAHLFAAEPALRALFATDLTAQRQKLVDELAVVVDMLGRLPALVARTTDLGRRHAVYGVEPHHYDLVLDAVVHAFTVCIPDEMTPDAVQAWRRAYHLVAETMMYGAARGPA